MFQETEKEKKQQTENEVALIKTIENSPSYDIDRMLARLKEINTKLLENTKAKRDVALLMERQVLLFDLGFYQYTP